MMWTIFAVMLCFISHYSSNLFKSFYLIDNIPQTNHVVHTLERVNGQVWQGTQVDASTILKFRNNCPLAAIVSMDCAGIAHDIDVYCTGATHRDGTGPK